MSEIRRGEKIDIYESVIKSEINKYGEDRHLGENKGSLERYEKTISCPKKMKQPAVVKKSNQKEQKYQ